MELTPLSAVVYLQFMMKIGIQLNVIKNMEKLKDEKSYLGL
jgi:hypothetical protein